MAARMMGAIDDSLLNLALDSNRLPEVIADLRKRTNALGDTHSVVADQFRRIARSGEEAAQLTP
jgi:hypothetical protein